MAEWVIEPPPSELKDASIQVGMASFNNGELIIDLRPLAQPDYSRPNNVTIAVEARELRQAIITVFAPRGVSGWLDVEVGGITAAFVSLGSPDKVTRRDFCGRDVDSGGPGDWPSCTRDHRHELTVNVENGD